MAYYGNTQKAFIGYISVVPSPLKVYADGCCLRNGQPDARAGVGVYFGNGDGRNISERLGGKQTNQRAELMAVIRAIEQAGYSRDLVVYTDSQYVINSMTKWIHTWKRRGWVNAKGYPVSNADLIQELDDMISERYNEVELKYVAGHQGIHGNEEADRLARRGALKALYY